MKIRMMICTAVAALIGITVSNADETVSNADDNASRDTAVQRLQGRWAITAGANQGRELNSAELGDSYMVVTTNSMVVVDRDERERYRAVFTIDEQTDPIEITMRAVLKQVSAGRSNLESQDVAENLAAGIVRFESPRRFVLCYALPGAERPKAFVSTAADRTMLFKLEKADADPVPDETKAAQSATAE